MEDNKTAKDNLYIEAKEEFNVKLDRRSTLADLQDQMDRLRKNGKQPEKVLPARVPKKLRNVVTGNLFDYDPLFAKNPDLEIVEWETADGDDESS
ncbi:MAG TPA: hypothetical protein DCW74_00145 [Alteromonas australica]|uniref:Uncharacterized protein n=1 Tax=Alteromonas australica TaxID=589873 RepID=A0A350NYL0_9ALTE|nr:hypothetical protein [Alteromonas australica]